MAKRKRRGYIRALVAWKQILRQIPTVGTDIEADDWGEASRWKEFDRAYLAVGGKFPGDWTEDAKVTPDQARQAIDLLETWLKNC